MIFGRNIDDNCTTDLMFEKIFRCTGNYCLHLKDVSKLRTLQHYEKKVFIIEHTFYKITALLSAMLSESKKTAFQG